MNKGPDNEKVWPLVNIETLLEIAKKLNVDTILDFHNHPNPDPRRLLTCLPRNSYRCGCSGTARKLAACEPQR